MRIPGRTDIRFDNLTVVYDGGCILCRRSVRWLRGQRTHVGVMVMPATSPEAVARFGDTPEYGEHMIAASDDNRMWIGVPDAYLAVMWSVRGLRLLSYVLSIAPLKPLVGRVFRIVTGNRHVIGRVIGEGCVHCAPPA